MTQVTAQEVQGIIKVDPELDLQPFIETASLIVTEDLANSGLSSNRLKQVELYLAAHYTAIRSELGGLIQEKTLNAESRYSDVYSAGLNSTRYGQQAITFDTSGTLANQAAPKKKSEFRVV